MSYYSDLKKRDVVEWMKPLIDDRTYIPRIADGKFEIGATVEPTSPPWHFINESYGAQCVYLHHLFSTISPRTPAGMFVPRRCQQCWKIVIRPRTLKELFVVENVLTQLGWPSKCGIEMRKYTPLSKHRYGGYIYSRSSQEASERLMAVRDVIAKAPGLGDGVQCYLKRGCTEMELAFPDSRTWSISDEQARVEDILDWLVVCDIPASGMSKHVLDKVHIKWIEWAAENGDETYLEYTDGKRLYPDCVRYEPVAQGTDEATPEGETVSAGPSSRAVPKGSTRRKTKEKK